MADWMLPVLYVQHFRIRRFGCNNANVLKICNLVSRKLQRCKLHFWFILFFSRPLVKNYIGVRVVLICHRGTKRFWCCKLFVHLLKCGHTKGSCDERDSLQMHRIISLLLHNKIAERVIWVYSWMHSLGQSVLNL